MKMIFCLGHPVKIRMKMIYVWNTLKKNEDYIFKTPFEQKNEDYVCLRHPEKEAIEDYIYLGHPVQERMKDA